VIMHGLINRSVRIFSNESSEDDYQYVVDTWGSLTIFFNCMDYMRSNDRVVWNIKLQKMWIKAAVNYLR